LKIDINNLESSLFDLLDQIKVLISQETWENILLNCTKNELLVFLLMYRQEDVNMTQIAEYISVPLNTATGIVSRMEKKHMVVRIRSNADKRVVMIQLTETGKQQISLMMQAFLNYGQQVITALSPEELALIGKVITKVITILQDEKKLEYSDTPKVRKITIE
jgi:DNA-binding MarR family transcriptional regulator